MLGYNKHYEVYTKNYEIHKFSNKSLFNELIKQIRIKYE